MKYIKYIPLILCGLLVIVLSILIDKNTTLKKELDLAASNEKAYIQENIGLKNQNRVFQLTIEQLEYFQDSLITKMDNTRKELNIKNKELKNLQYLLTEASKNDTIIFRDTIFKDTTLCVDTIIGDEWYKVCLGLQYPNIIITEPIFKSEKYIVTSTKKETIKPPKKCKFLRWFQKKHKVLEVNIVEKSPYIENKKQRFIEIIK